MFCSNCGIQCSVNANFCHSCGRNLQEQRDSLSRGENENDLVNIIADYFHQSYPYATITELLKKQGIVMHLRTLKRRLGNMGLLRRGTNVDEDMVRNIVTEEMIGAGRLVGYRSIWHAPRLRHQVHVPRSLVAHLVKELDPEGVEERRSQHLTRHQYTSLEPNFCWNIDGKFFKLAIYVQPSH